MGDSHAPRRRRLLAIAAVALVALATAGAVAWPAIVRRVIVWQLVATTGRAVTLAAVDLELFGGRIVLRDLRVMDRDQAPLATVERLEARFSPGALVRGHVRITGATVQRPVIRIVRTGPGEFNISDLLARESEGGTALAVTLEQLELRGGTVAIEDRTLAPPRTWRMEAVTLDARSVSTRPEAPPGVVALSAVAAGSPISLWVSGVRLSPLRFQATAIARAIEASLAALYLPPGSPLSPVRGTLDVTATIEHDAAAGSRLSLDAVFGGVELRPPDRDGTALSFPAVRVTVEDLRVRPGAVELGRLAVDGGIAVLEDARLAPVRRWRADGIAVEVRNLSSARDAPAGTGTARATVAGSPVSVWVGELRLAPLALHAIVIVRNVDVSLFRLYVPPDLPVQPEGGIANASLRVDHDERGTRLALDAGLAGVALRRPAHFVTAPALQVRAEDIAFGGGAVTVGRVAVTGDRLTIEDRTLRPPRRWAVQDLAVEASRLSSRREDVQGVASARATVAGASVSAWVTQARIDPLELRATAILRNLDLPLVQLYLPEAAPVHLDRGVVNASLQVDHDVAGGTQLTGDATLTGLEARGRHAAAGLAASARSLRVALAGARRSEGVLDVGRLELTGSGSLADSRTAARIDLERLRLASEGVTWPIRGPARVELSARLRDGGEVDASGTALLTAPPPMIAWTAELAVKLAAVDVGPAAAYVPAARGLGGRVNASVTANVAHGASLTARVQGDAGATRIALAEGGRTLLSLRRLDAIGLDVLWPERVAARQLRLERPHALIERDRRRAPRQPDSFTAASPAPEATPRAIPAIAIDEVVVERGSLALVDAREGAPGRLDVPRIDLTLRDARWPATAPARLQLDAVLPEGGTVAVEGLVTGEPAAVDLKVALVDARLSLLQPYLPFRAGAGGRADASLAVAGPLLPSPRLTARGDVTLRDLALSDGRQSVLTVERLGATGIDVTWPDRATVDKVRIRRSWALIQRDSEGRFLLRTLLQRPSGTAAPVPAPGPAAPPFEFRLGEGIFEDQAATIIDAVTTPPAHFEIAGARLVVSDLTWPPRGPVKLQLTSPMPQGGRLDVGGALALEPVRLQARATLDGVELAPAQPYLPIEGRVAGRVTGDLSVDLALDPLAVRVTGQTRLQGFRLSDRDRPLVTAGRVEATGIDIDWPRRVAVQQVLLRRPSLLIERDAQGDVALPGLVTPRWPAAPAGPADMGGSGRPPTAPALGAPPRSRGAPRQHDSFTDPAPAPTASPAAARPGLARPAIEIATVRLEQASGRFVDQTTAPSFAEELSRVDVTVTGLTTAPGGLAHFTGGGALGGGGAFTLQGKGAVGDPPRLELKVDVRDYAIARANPYLDRFTTWTATRGTLAASASYTVLGPRLDARHDVVARGLEVAHSGPSDAVEQRLGLSLGFLVSLLKDARGELRLSVPVSGDLGTREFDFQEAVWGAVRALAIRLLALPFSKFGSLFFTEDSRVEAVAVAPAVFETGTARLTAPMPAHLDRIAAFLKTTPSVTVRLAAILTGADLDALKRERVMARLATPPGAASGGDTARAARREFSEHWPDRPVPPTFEAIVAELAAHDPPASDDAVRGLAARRLEIVRQELTGRGIDPGRLPGTARRVPLVEATGPARVELDLRP